MHLSPHPDKSSSLSLLHSPCHAHRRLHRIRLPTVHRVSPTPETLGMEPKSTTPPPPPPVMGAPVAYPPATAYAAPGAVAYPPAAAYPGPGAVAYPPAAGQQPPHQQGSATQQQLQIFWAEQYREIEATTDFKNHNLPLARIKKIMKADEDVRMISAEAPVVFARACEMFILELTHRGWAHAEENKRRTLQKSDIAAAVARTEVFDFLVDIVPRDEAKDAEAAAAAVGAGIPHPAAGMPATDPMAYYYVQPQ